MMIAIYIHIERHLLDQARQGCNHGGDELENWVRREASGYGANRVKGEARKLNV